MYLLSEMRRRCRVALGPVACCSSVELLGCTAAELEAHLGRPNPSLVVYASPPGDLTDEAEQRRYFHYTNLQVNGKRKRKRH